MYSFEGDFRRKPQQNLAGASVQDGRLALLERAHQERQRREDYRKRLQSAIIIQSYIRSFIVRQKTKRIQRIIFDECIKENPQPTQPILQQLISRLVFFYSKKYDFDRLIVISQLIIKLRKCCLRLALTCTAFSWAFNQLLVICSNQVVSSEGVVHAMPLRVLEVYTDFSSQTEPELVKLKNSIVLNLIKNGYFSKLRYLLEARTPPLLDTNPVPPTPHVAAIFSLITRCLDIVKQTGDRQLIHLLLKAFCDEVLSLEFTDPIKLFLIPALANSPSYVFPFVPLLTCLSRDKTFTKSTWLLYSFLSLEPNNFNLNTSEISSSHYLEILSGLSANLSLKYRIKTNLDADDEVDEMDNDSLDKRLSTQEAEILSECSLLFNKDTRVRRLLDVMSHIDDEQSLHSICKLCHYLLVSDDFAVHKYKLLYTLAFRVKFLRCIWNFCHSLTSTNSWTSSRTLLLAMLSRGISMTPEDTGLIVPPLTVFCELFSLLISTLHDGEFSSDNNIPFTLQELIPVVGTLKDVCLGLVELAFPDSRPSIPHDYQLAVRSQELLLGQNTTSWVHLFKVLVHLLRQLHTRDLRLSFCPEDLWIANNVIFPSEKPNDLQIRRGRTGYQPFRGIRSLTRDEIDVGPPLSIKEVRFLTILRELPFVVPFSSRVQVFQSLLQVERMLQHGDVQEFLRGPAIVLKLRRSHLYEDAFDKLSPANEPNLRLKMRVQLINAAGLEEAGVDGGGVFREVLSELLHTAFDPNRGFFRIAQDHSLYPNPAVGALIEDYHKHYYFIGRILGKALFENLLVDLPLAEFFLCKLVGPSIVDAHHLASLDPVLHRTLLSLKNFTGDVADLGLDFTVMSDDLGEMKTEELKPGGASITVNATNRIEYIHLMADYKLNKQIRTQCLAFRQGLDNVLPLDWLHMFSFKELQILISGSEMPMDVEDLKRNTSYTGGYSAEHPTIGLFWRVLEKFDDLQRRLLLKFVTSCSRPPLLGFKDLEPPFCIQLAGSADRLPTASTCINLLKLPEFLEENVLRDRLLYAIQSGSGFELS